LRLWSLEKRYLLAAGGFDVGAAEVPIAHEAGNEAEKDEGS